MRGRRKKKRERVRVRVRNESFATEVIEIRIRAYMRREIIYSHCDGATHTAEMIGISFMVVKSISAELGHSHGW